MSLTAQAASLGSPSVTAQTPERPEDLPEIPREDWEALVDGVLDKARGSRLDMPMPQLLLRIADHLTRLAENGEHLKHFTGATSRDQEDLAGAVDERIKAANRKRLEVAKRVDGHDVDLDRLRERVAVLEAALTALDDAATVQGSNPSAHLNA